MKKIGFLMVMLFGVKAATAQFGLSAGISTLKSFTTPTPYFGFHFGGEIPRDDQMSFYGRATYYLKQLDKPINQLYLFSETDPSLPMQKIDYQNSMDYFILEGGNRYYIGNGYDAGFGGYGGGNMMLIFNTVRRNYEYGAVSQVQYPLPSTELPKGSIFNLAVGVGGGLKYTASAVGTFYFDVNAAYMILSTASNATAQGVTSTLYSPLIFNFSLGFRKDLY